MRRKPERTLEELETFLQQNLPHADVIAHENRTEVHPKEFGVCDFCSEILREESHHFEVPDFEIKPGLFERNRITWGSNGAWGACPSCKPFVLNNDSDGLLKRCCDSMQKLHPNFPPKMTRECVKTAHSGFWMLYRARPKT